MATILPTFTLFQSCTATRQLKLVSLFDLLAAARKISGKQKRGKTSKRKTTNQTRKRQGFWHSTRKLVGKRQRPTYIMSRWLTKTGRLSLQNARHVPYYSTCSSRTASSREFYLLLFFQWLLLLLGRPFLFGRSPPWQLSRISFGFSLCHFTR